MFKDFLTGVGVIAAVGLGLSVYRAVNAISSEFGPNATNAASTNNRQSK
jgi:hypothetical protein